MRLLLPLPPPRRPLLPLPPPPLLSLGAGVGWAVVVGDLTRAPLCRFTEKYGTDHKCAGLPPSHPAPIQQRQRLTTGRLLAQGAGGDLPAAAAAPAG